VSAGPARLPGRDLVLTMLRLGATSYGGPAIMGILQAELQERRGWVSRERFLEGLSLVSMLPGATATQLAIFLAHARAGWWGGLVGGLCFVLPGLAVMLALSIGWARAGGLPAVQGALDGIGPVVLATFAVAVARLGQGALRSPARVAIAAGAAAAALATSIGVAGLLLLAGALGVLLFHDRRAGAAALATVAWALAALAALPWAWPGAGPPAPSGRPPGLGELAGFFLTVGAFTVGGGLAMIAFIQEHAVGRLGWLSADQFLAGLALGQLTPGPILMLAAYVGYTQAGTPGAVVAAAAAFAPSFALMLGLLPLLDRARRLRWTRAALQGMGAAVVGLLAVALLRLAPAALPDAFAGGLAAAAALAAVLWRLGPVPLVLAGGLAGLLRGRWRSPAAAWGGGP
jgi:chromate transporter